MIGKALILILLAAGPALRAEHAGGPRATQPEIAGIYANPIPVERAPKIDDKAAASADPAFQELLRTIQLPEYQKWADEKLSAMGSKLAFRQLVAKWHADHPRLSTTQLALNLAALDHKGKSVLGGVNPKLCQVLTPYAQAMANADQSNAHAGVEGRWAGFKHFEEIVQGGYPVYAKSDASMLQAARDCMATPSRRLMVNGIWTTYEPTGWQTSPKHWASVVKQYKSFCYDMRKSVTGAYYCVGAFSDRD